MQNLKLKFAILCKYENEYEFAKAIRVSQSAVSFWISGKSLPLLCRLGDICTILDCKANDIFTLDQIKAMQKGKHKGRRAK